MMDERILLACSRVAVMPRSSIAEAWRADADAVPVAFIRKLRLMVRHHPEFVRGLQAVLNKVVKDFNPFLHVELQGIQLQLSTSYKHWAKPLVQLLRPRC